jgi:hypothetical protein
MRDTFALAASHCKNTKRTCGGDYGTEISLKDDKGEEVFLFEFDDIRQVSVKKCVANQ